MNILGPLAAGLALTPLASKTFGQLADSMKQSFADLLITGPASEEESPADDDLAMAEQLGALKQSVREQLIAGGINSADRIALGITDAGIIEVRSPHVQATEIEQLLNANPELRQQFFNLANAAMGGAASANSTSTSLDDFELEIDFETAAVV